MPHDGIASIPMRRVLVGDLFCGAGGSSTGAARAMRALGYEMVLTCVNHWPIAIASHQKNHPNARHYLQDVNVAKPTECVPEGKLDLLMASPTCTFHSRARGGKPINDQGRMDPWAVIHWCTELRVKRLIVENVPEFREWGPINLKTGRPLKKRKGEYFRAWVTALEGAGFKVEWRVLNAANFGDATTRERFFLMARSDGRRIRWPEPTHCRSGADLLSPLQKWRAAREIIDWSIAGKSIFDRKRPLAPKTLARIYAGAVKLRWPEPFLVILRNHMGAQSLDDPVTALCAGGNHIGLAEPFTLSNSSHGAPRAVDQPLMTITTGGASNIKRPGCARPAVVEPIPTADCRGAGYLCEPMVMRSDQTGGGGLNVRSAEDPPFTVTGNHGGGLAVVEPFIANLAHSGADESRCRAVDEPLQTLHAGGGSHAVVEPFVLSQDGRGAPRAVDEPVPTIVGAGAVSLIAPYYGSGSGETCGSVETPLPTVTTKARFGLVVPVINSRGGPRPRAIDDPLPTMTTAKGGEFALVMPVTHNDGGNRARSVQEPLPTVTGAHRGELACIVAAFGERPGQAPRFRSVEQPAPTICANGRVQLAEGVTDGRQYDIRFRMLEPKELARAMGFSDDETEYEFVGTKTDITKQIGNAVPVNTACALVSAIMGN